ncbi:ImmA/IrrE family metallo-endopeptidase [Phyllobacterium ifriqiyense]|uniref:ImmA/IrrE family metallo-endopeptidase n=1 Tax=Phyllobacterium ifriqiyense TaxID=314238 RepID=UPI003393055B
MRSREWDRVLEKDREIIDKYIKEIPVRLGALAEELGLSVTVGTLMSGISGEIRPDRETDGKYIIRVNRHETKERQRFTLAHEIGHFLLHKDKIGDGISDDVLYRSELSNSLEAEANRIAADILMPRQVIEKILSLNNKLDDDQIKDLARKFKVSPAAMEIRLGLKR